MRDAAHGRRFERRLLPLLLVLLLTTHRALAGDPPDFDKAVARCHELVRNDRFVDGERALRALFTDFAGDDRVRARLTEIEEDLKVCLFRRVKPAPTGKDLFGTACEQFNAATRAVSFEFYKPHGEFWSKPEAGGLRMCTVAFEGDVTVAFSTEWMNKDKTVASIVLCWDAERGNGYVCYPGYFRIERNFDTPPPGQPAVPDTVFTAERAIVRVKDGVETKLFEKPPEQQRFSFTGGIVTAARNGNRITLKMSDAVVATGSDATFTTGCVGIRSDEPTGISIKGKIEARWLSTLVGQRLAAAFAEWQKSSYDRAKEIPEWALSAGGTAAAADTTLRDLPSDAPAASAEALGTLAPRSMAGDASAAAEAEAAAATAPRATALYLRALWHLANARYADATATLTELLRLEPKFVAARLVSGFCNFRMLRLDQARSDLDAVIAARPQCEYAHQLAVSLAIYEQDYDAADARLAAATKSGIPDQALAYWRKIADRARRGPLFAQRFEAATAHHVVVSDHSKAMCDRVAAELEAMQVQYIAALGITPPPGPKSRVFVFASQRGYQTYLAELQKRAGPSSTGMYLPALRALVLWVTPDADEFTGIVRHEGFHAFLHRLVDKAPSWFDEGCAGFMEYGGTDNTAVRDVGPDVRASFLPVRQLLALREPEFLAKGDICFPESRCLVAFLRTTTNPKLRNLLRDYLSALRDGLSPDEAAAKVVDPVIEVLETEFSRSR